MHGPRPKRSGQQGFSLVELSIVIAIVSVVAVLGLESMSIFMHRTAYRTTQERLDVLKEAIAKHRYVYGYLPCPAGHTLGPASTTYGKEQRDEDGCTGPRLNGVVTYGDVPVRDLNLPLRYLRDGYGTKFRYVVTNDMVRAGTTTNRFSHANTTGGIAIRTGKIEQPCNTMCQKIADAAYLVLSFGADKRGSDDSNCVPSALFDGKIDSVNCRFGNGQEVRINGSGAVANIPDNVFYDSRYNNGNVEEMHFDDLIIWQVKGQL